MRWPSLVIAAAALGQEPAPIRVTTQMVQVSVVVHDKQGRAVRGLAREDFRLLDAGVEQQIRSFVPESAESGPPRLPAGVFSNRIGERRVVTVIVLDQLNCLLEDETRGRSELLEFLRTAEPGHRIALLSLSSDLKILHELTTDTRSVARVLQGFTPGRSVTAAAIRPEPNVAKGFARIDALIEAGKARERAQQTGEAAATLAGYLRRIAGRKNLVWMSTVFPGSLMARVREDDVAIYTIDVRGIRGREEPPQPGDALAPIVDGVMDGARVLAARTGGLPYYGLNELHLGLERAIQDAAAVYLLGYYPSHTNWDGKYHRIEVTVRRPEVEARHRMGYFATPEQTEPVVRDRRQAMQALLTAPDDESAIAIDIQLGPLAGTMRAIGVFIDPRTLTFEQKNGRWMDELDLVVVAQKENGESFGSRMETFPIDVPQETYRDVILRKGVVLKSRLKTSPAAYRVRIIVREVRTGAAGSVTAPL